MSKNVSDARPTRRLISNEDLFKEMAFEWTARRLNEMGLRQGDLADAIGISRSKMSKTLRGSRRLQMAEAAPMARFLEIPLESLVDRFGEEQTQVLNQNRSVPEAIALTISAAVRQGRISIDYLTDADRHTTPLPPIWNDGVAAVIRDNSMGPRYLEDEVIYYQPEQGSYPAKYIGHDCIVAMLDGSQVLRRLEGSTKRWHYTLLSYAAGERPDIDVEIDWAAPVVWHLTMPN